MHQNNLKNEVEIFKFSLTQFTQGPISSINTILEDYTNPIFIQKICEMKDNGIGYWRKIRGIYYHLIIF